jgi:hypothetical protein
MARKPESREDRSGAPARSGPDDQTALPSSRSPDEHAWLQRLDKSIDRASIKPDRAAARPPTPPRPPDAPILVQPPHPASLDSQALLAQCVFRKGRSSGPGGQHRNKVETLVELLHEPTGVEAHAGERRSATENHRVATSRLRLALATRARASVPTGDCRSPLWRSRCKGGRIVVSTSHEDFPAILAEALDVLWACDLDPKSAAARLCCTMSQLVKLLKDHAPAWVWVNAHRAALGLYALK